MSWEWMEIGRGAVAMVNPMGVLTNLHVVDGDGAVLSSTEAAPYVNQLVRKLPWQVHVLKLLNMSG